jgi:hypothetical protein
MPTKMSLFILLITYWRHMYSTSVIIDKKSKRSHKIVEIRLLLDPDPHKIMTDPDPDPEHCGSAC